MWNSLRKTRVGDKWKKVIVASYQKTRNYVRVQNMTSDGFENKEILR